MNCSNAGDTNDKQETKKEKIEQLSSDVDKKSESDNSTTSQIDNSENGQTSVNDSIPDRNDLIQTIDQSTLTSIQQTTVAQLNDIRVAAGNFYSTGKYELADGTIIEGPVADLGVDGKWVTVGKGSRFQIGDEHWVVIDLILDSQKIGEIEIGREASEQPID